MDPAGVALGAIAMVAPVYDACDRAYSGLKVMACFGQDFQTLWRQLEGYWVTLHLLMNTKSATLKSPPDLQDTSHHVTRVMIQHLKELATQFEVCEKLLANQLKQSGIDLSLLGINSDSGYQSQDQSRASGQGLSPVSSPPPATPEATSQDSMKASESILRKAKPAYWRERSSRKAGKNKVSEQSANAASPERLQDSLEVLQIQRALRTVGIPGLPDTPSQEDAQRIQRATGTWVHVKWAHHIKEDFEASLAKIEKAVDMLVRILALRDLEEPAKMLQDRDKLTVIDPARLTWAQQHILDVHKELCKLQKEGTIPASRLSVALFENPSQLWDEIEEQDDSLLMGVHPEAMMMWIQLSDGTSGEDSRFLLVETTAALRRNEPPPIMKGLPSIPGSASVAQVARIEPVLDLCGASRSERDDRGHWHCVFADPQPWRQKTTLRDVLAQGHDLDKTLTPLVLLELFKGLIMSHLKVAWIEPHCSNFRLENIRYFEPCDYAIDDSTSDWLMHPYFDIGFGQPQPVRRIGLQSGPTKDPNTAVLELGLVLFALASHRAVDYSPSQGRFMSDSLRHAKTDALNRLVEVEMRYQGRFADIVSACLQANAGNQHQTVEAARFALNDMEEHLRKEADLMSRLDKRL